MTKIDAVWPEAFVKGLLRLFALAHNDAGMDEYLLGCHAELPPLEAELAFGSDCVTHPCRTDPRAQLPSEEGCAPVSSANRMMPLEERAIVRHGSGSFPSRCCQISLTSTNEIPLAAAASGTPARWIALRNVLSQKAEGLNGVKNTWASARTSRLNFKLAPPPNE